MTTMYIANPTNQNRIINYQLPELAKVFTQHIGMGQQTRIAGRNGDLGPKDIDLILEHLGKYGICNVDELNRANGLVPLIYSDRPIRSDVIAKALNHNKGIRVAQGRNARMRAALAVNAAIESHANTVEAEVPFTEVGIDEENQGSFASEGPAISEGVHITKQPGEQTEPRARARRGKKVGFAA